MPIDAVEGDGPPAPRPQRLRAHLRRLDRLLQRAGQGLPRSASIDARTLEFTTGPLRPREGITVEISMPSDAVARPGWWKELSWWLADNFPYAVFPATLAVCFFSWFFRGRDLPGHGDDRGQLRGPRRPDAGRGGHARRREGRSPRHLGHDHRPGRPRLPQDRGARVAAPGSPRGATTGSSSSRAPKGSRTSSRGCTTRSSAAATASA